MSIAFEPKAKTVRRTKKAKAGDQALSPWGSGIDYSVALAGGDTPLPAVQNPETLTVILQDRYSSLPAVITSDAEYKAAQNACGEIRSKRAQIEARRKELKSGAIEYGKMVDAEAARWTAILDEVQKPIIESRKAWEAAKEAEKQARIAEEKRIAAEKAEAERKAAIDEALAKERAEQAKAKEEHARTIREALERTRLAQEQAAKDRKAAEEAAAERAKIEAERAELAAERERLDRLRASMEQTAKQVEPTQQGVQLDAIHPTDGFNPGDTIQLPKPTIDEFMGDPRAMDFGPPLAEQIAAGSRVDTESRQPEINPEAWTIQRDYEDDAAALSELLHALSSVTVPVVKTEDGKAIVRTFMDFHQKFLCDVTEFALNTEDPNSTKDQSNHG